MPIPIPPTAPYDVLNTILNTARVRLNDAIQSLGGDIIKNDQPFTQQMANTAWRRFQEYLANLGEPRLNKRVIVTGLPVVDSQDPATQVSLGWSGYANALGGVDTDYVLPQDFILPLWVKERLTGQNAYFVPMYNCTDGLPSTAKQGYNRIWDWREDALWMPGALNSVDLEMRYAAFLNDFATEGDTNWYDQPVPIMRCLDPLASFICAEAAKPRGDVDGEAFVRDGEAKSKLIFNRSVRQKVRVNVRRQPRSGGRGYMSSDAGSWNS